MKNLFVAISLAMLLPTLSACQPARVGDSISVTNISRSLDMARPGYTMCKSFRLSRRGVAAYFAVAKQVSGDTLHSDAIILPCEYHGTLLMRGQVFDWRINAGGAGYLYQDNEPGTRYLCEARCRKALSDMFR